MKALYRFLDNDRVLKIILLLLIASFFVYFGFILYRDMFTAPQLPK